MQGQQLLEMVRQQATAAAHALAQAANLRSGQLVVIGCSTSEVIGKRIGTSGTLEVAHALLQGIELLKTQYGVRLAIQCCEHLNRALVVERDTCSQYQLEEVRAVPVPHAGGSMAAAAYSRMEEPCLVEHIHAHAGMDIGETLIGMHLKHVAVPLRTEFKQIGSARVTMAGTRPKLIGGERAVYQLPESSSSTCD